VADRIRLPDGTTVSADELKAMGANNDIESGPGGTAIDQAIASGTYTAPKRSTSTGAGSNTYNTNSGGPATTGSTKADPGTNFGYGGSAKGDASTDRTRSIYEGRPGESLDQWMGRVFRQSTRDYGGVLSPDADNPLGRTPYANWFQNRYSDVVPANQLLSKLLTNSGMGEDFAPNMQGSMQDFFANGTGRGFGTGVQGSQQNLGSLNDLLNSFAAGNQEGLSPEQVTALGGIMDDPNMAMTLVNAQLSGGIGANPLASKYIAELGKRSVSDYYDDIVGQSPDPSKGQGTFLNNFLKRINYAR
jgi:hypothetical protein